MAWEAPAHSAFT